MNQLTRFVEASGDPEQRVTTHSYLQGQKRSTVKPDGVSLHYEYNILGLLQNFWGSDHSFHYRYTYNRNLLPTLIEDMKNGTANCLSYDSENQLIEEVLGNELTLKYGYDALGRIQRVGLPDATDIEYFYSPCALKEVRRGSIKHIYENYNLLGQVTEVLLTNGQRATYAYDLKGRPKEIAAPHFQESDFNYDAVGNLTSYRQVDSLGTVSNAYAYDELYQLVSERNHTYSHDSLFNRLSKDGTSYGVNVLNQITSQGNFEYSYDACGNLIERSSPTETVRFAYDALDRLTSVKTPMETITYTYDSFNRRLFANEKRFVYQGQNEIGAFENGVFTELRLLDPSKEAEIGAAVAVILKDIVYTPIHDHNGNVACLIDPTNIPLTYRYSAYGEEETSLLASNPWRFASKRLDPETGFIFFGHRYYDPALGRFITTDPTGYDDGPNLYAYVRNNPLLSTDLYGLNFHHTGPDHNRPSFDPFERSRYSTSNESFNDRFSDIRSEYNDTHGSCAENFRDFASSLNLTGSWQDIAAARYWNDRQNSNDRQDEDRGFFDRIFDNLLDMGCAYINRHLDYACGCLDGFLNPIDSLRDIKDRFSSQPLSLRNIDYGTGVGIGILASIIPLGRTANVAVQTAKSSKLFRIFGRALGLEGFSLKNTYSVYQGVDAKGIVQYVGITFRKPIVRFTEHLRSVGTGKELLKYGSLRDAKNLTFTQARVWEQKLINQYGLKKNGGTLLNQRHSIAEKHWWKHRIN